MLELLKTLWRHWKGLAHRIIAAQNWLLMAIAYGIAMGPVSFVMRIKNPDLIDRGLGDESWDTFWLPLNNEAEDIRRAQRPW
jgi:nitroreductase